MYYSRRLQQRMRHPFLVAMVQSSKTKLVGAVAAGSIEHQEYQVAPPPLEIASMFGHSNMVRTLLNRGADVSGACGGGETTLHAPQVGPARVMEMLVKAGAA